MDVLREAQKHFINILKPQKSQKCIKILEVSRSNETWTYDNIEEFLAEYRKGRDGARMHLRCDDHGLFVLVDPPITLVSVEATSREEIESVFEKFESTAERCLLPASCEEVEKPTVFIGHGSSSLWRQLKDHLQDKHGYLIEAYEVGARAGHAIRDILEQMLEKSSFALFIMTGDDETSDGKLRARQNVIHEVGLFQGKLGFHRAIAIVENGVELFSNIEGIEQIRFSKGNIKETFGEVVATINREFGPNAK